VREFVGWLDDAAFGHILDCREPLNY